MAPALSILFSSSFRTRFALLFLLRSSTDGSRDEPAKIDIEGGRRGTGRRCGRIEELSRDARQPTCARRDAVSLLLIRDFVCDCAPFICAVRHVRLHSSRASATSVHRVSRRRKTHYYSRRYYFVPQSDEESLESIASRNYSRGIRHSKSHANFFRTI